MIDYTEQVEQVKEYYADLLILQYKLCTRARETIKLFAGMYLGDGVVFQLNDCLDIDTAEGAQLDLIGKILGVKRSIAGLTVGKKYFSFESAPTPYGFSDKNQLSEGYWKKYNNSIGSSTDLFDDDYRKLLKFKADFNLRGGSMAALDNLYYKHFGDDLKMTNNQDLSVTYTVSNLTTVIQAAILCGYIKPPMGIEYTFNYI